MTESQIMTMELGSKGYGCAQIIMIGLLRMIGEENEMFVRSISALSQGIANTGQTCGALIGGYCLLSMYTAKGNDLEETKKEEQMLLDDLNSWFKETFQVLTCDELLGIANCVSTEEKPCPKRIMGNEKCGLIVSSVYDKCLELLVEYGIDPYTLPSGE